MKLFVLVALIAVVGAGLLVAGLFLLFGLGWALVAAGLLLLALAHLARPGMTPPEPPTNG